MQYIHYGTTRFNPYLFTKIVNIPHRTKPDNGFWASPVNENLFTWEKWCEVEGFCDIPKMYLGKKLTLLISTTQKPEMQ